MQDATQPPDEPVQPPQEYQPEQQYQPLIPGVVKPQPEFTILEWAAPSRPFKKHNRQYVTTMVVIALLISLILFFAGVRSITDQALPIAVVISATFLAYVLGSIPPELVTYKITSYGLRIENSLYYWDELGRFWFSEKYGQKLLHAEVARFPNRLTLVLGDTSPEEVDEILSEALLHQKPEPTLYDKAAEWLQEKIPLDTSG